MQNTAVIARANNIAVIQFKAQTRETEPMQLLKTNTELCQI